MRKIMWILVAVLLVAFAGCDSCNLTPEEQQAAIADGILCGTTVTASITQCVVVCRPNPKTEVCKDTCVKAFLADTGAAKVCTDGLGKDFIKNPKIVAAINKGYELGVAIYEATKPTVVVDPVVMPSTDVVEPTDASAPVGVLPVNTTIGCTLFG